jgi:hypothetical protein
MPPDKDSIKLSRPNPIRAILPADDPAKNDITPSKMLYPTVKYERRSAFLRNLESTM